ncbi:MAG: FkbM family methyltransferase [Acidiferrobacterales bacterium]|nr:FkbM family methyltransferase [Acidiferrobacterales bacterium]
MAQIVYDTIGGVSLALRKGTPDRHVAKSCLLTEEFAPCRSSLPKLKFDLIIDAGGYIGTAAIWFALNYPDARILTIEPSQANFEILLENIHPFPNITALNKAIVARSRKVDLMDRGTGDWGFSIVEQPRDNPSPESLHLIDGITLDELIYDADTGGVDILKLDIEGGEKEVFDFPGYWARNTRLIVAELHNRITLGCSQSFEIACAHMEKLPASGGEKVFAVNQALI